MQKGNLQQALQYAAENPNSDFARQLGEHIKSGAADAEAQSLGINLTPIKNASFNSSANQPITQSANQQSPTDTGIIKLPGQDTVQNFAQGVAKGEVSTVKGLSDLGEKIANNTVGRVINAVQGKGFVPTDTSNGVGSTFNNVVGGNQNAQSLTQPSNLSEGTGFGAEKLAELFIPAAKAAKAEQAVNLLSQGIESTLLAASARIAGKAAIQGVSSGLVTAAQTGGDVAKTVTSALTAGVIRGGMAVIGEGANALKIPERIYSTIFKNTKSDMLDELKTNGLATLQQNNPQKFQDFVDKGLIKVSTDGAPVLNETLAEQALNKGLSGSIRNMANTVVEGILDSENQARAIAQNYTGTVNLAEPQIKNVLNSISAEYQDVGFGEISKEASRLAGAIENGNGEVSAIDALDIRRLLDKARIARSFDTQTSKLSLGQQNLKTLADAVRGRVNAVPGMGDVMKNYSFYLDAMDTLGNEAKRRGNNQVISLIDSLFLSNAFGGAHPAGLTFGAALRKVLSSGWGATALGQALKNNTASRLTSGLISGTGGATSALVNQ